MNISVRISTGGVVHMLKHSGMTLCGKHFHSGSKGNWDDKVTCKSCIKIEARKAEVEAAIVRNAQLVDELEAQLHPKVQEVDLEALAETATKLHEANAHSDDRSRSASDSQPYMTSKRIMLKAIMDAYPALCPSDVYEVRMDGGDPIKWCVKSIVSGQLSYWGGRGGQCPEEIGCMLCLASAARVHPKPEVTEDDDSGCEGHESLSGAHMGETVFCDGSCVRTVDRAARRRGYVPATWRSKHKGSKARRVRSHA